MLQDALGTALGRKFGRLGRQVGRLGCHVGRLGRQVGSPGRSKRRSEPPPTPFRTRAQARPKVRTIGRRFFVVFVLSRASSDVLPDTVFTEFCCSCTKLAPHARAQARQAEMLSFRHHKRPQQRPGRTKIEVGRPCASAKCEVQPHFF